MIGYFSPSTASMVFEKEGRRFVQHLGGNCEQLSCSHVYGLSAANDWIEIKGNTQTDMLATFSTHASQHRFLSLAYIVLQGLSPRLSSDVCLELEALLTTSVSADWVLDHLLAAPLKDRSSLTRLSNAAAKSACTAVAAIADELSGFQIPLLRLVNRWIGLPSHIWTEGPLTQVPLWNDLVNTGAIRSLLGVIQSGRNGDRFVRTWNQYLTLQFRRVEETKHSQAIGIALKDQLFDRSETFESGIGADDTAFEDIDRSENRQYRPVALRRQFLEEAQSNVQKIVSCIRRGEDLTAERYIREFVARQLSRGDADYAVKTLCSIAQKCNHLLRYDFEKTCLLNAIQLRGNDARALVQLGDLYKRTRNFVDANKVLSEAATLADGETLVVAKSLAADIYAAQGHFDTAIEKYHQINGWENIEEVLTAIADCLRASGNLSEAERAYQSIAQRWGQTLRVAIGTAELLKAGGQIQEALQKYESITDSLGTPTAIKWEDSRETRIAWFSKINAMKQLHLYHEAQSTLEKLKQIAPDDMTVRIQLSMIYSLLDRSLSDCLREMGPLGQPKAAGDWLRYCVRGLLQLKSGWPEGARQSLIARWELAKSEQPDNALRLAAATAFLRFGEFDNAREALQMTDARLEPFYGYIQSVLEYHVALVEQNPSTASESRMRLDPIGAAFPPIMAVITALDDRDFRRACELVTKLLLVAI